MNETRPGYKTTEFWITVIVLVADLALALVTILPPTWASTIATVTTTMYVMSRALAKHGIPTDPK